MTKDTEIELLDSMIKSFGKDSYLGPWFAEVRDTLVRDIRNDVCMSAPMPRIATLHGERIIESAKEEAAKIRKQADEYAMREIQKADKAVSEQRRYAKHFLTELAGKIY